MRIAAVSLLQQPNVRPTQPNALLIQLNHSGNINIRRQTVPTRMQAEKTGITLLTAATPNLTHHQIIIAHAQDRNILPQNTEALNHQAASKIIPE
jgi:hypothetical protein